MFSDLDMVTEMALEFSNFNSIFTSAYVGQGVCVCVCLWGGVPEEEGIRSIEPGVPGDCVPSDVGVGNRNKVL